MQNFVHQGKVLYLTAPYTVSSGGGAQIGTYIFGVATKDYTSGDTNCEFLIEGVLDLISDNSSFDPGDLVYWDNSAKKATSTSTNHLVIGVVEVASTATPVRTKLTPNPTLLAMNAYGVTATAAEINKLAAVTAGAISASKGLVVGASQDLTGATYGLNLAVTALASGDSYSGLRSVVSVLNASNSYGSAGYFESDITGTQAGEFHYVFGAWANINSGTVGAGKYICAQDNGIWEDSGATITNAKLIYGMRMECILGDTDGLMFPFSSNNNNVPITALFDVNNITDLGVTAVSKTTTATYLPIARDAGGNLRYVLLYS